MTAGFDPSKVAVVSGAAADRAAVAAELSTADGGWQGWTAPSGWTWAGRRRGRPGRRRRCGAPGGDGPRSGGSGRLAAGHYAIVPVDDIGLSAWNRMLRVHLGDCFTCLGQSCRE